MGKAKIIENIGEGLYKACPLYDLSSIERELQQMQDAESRYDDDLSKMRETIRQLRDSQRIASNAVDAVIAQWQADLIRQRNDVPEPLEPPPNSTDPETGQPWTDPARAQEPLLLSAINAARSQQSHAALTRHVDLDKAALRLLREQAGTGRIGHLDGFGRTPANRVAIAGYAASMVGETLDYGGFIPTQIVDEWLRNPDAKATILDSRYTDVGIAHVYAPLHPAAYLWAGVYAQPGPPPPASDVAKVDPAKTGAMTADDALKKIELPTTDPLTPENLAKILGELGKVAAQRVAAEKELEKRIAEHLARIARAEEIETLKNKLESLEIDVWACYYNDQLAENEIVYTAEVPGHWIDNPISKSVTLGKNTAQQRTVIYQERSWNIVKRVAGLDSQLKPALSMMPEATFFNAAVEPGHIKWRPAWRYGVITAMAGSVCSVRLNSAESRAEQRRDRLGINDKTTLDDVPIDYPPCGGAVFLVDDEVLIRYLDQDREKPVIVGFRREPRRCPRDGKTWEQIL